MERKNLFKIQGRDEKGRFTSSIETAFLDDEKDKIRWTIFDQSAWNWMYLSISKITPLSDAQYFIKDRYMPGLAKAAFDMELSIVDGAKDRLIELSFQYIDEVKHAKNDEDMCL